MGEINGSHGPWYDALRSVASVASVASVGAALSSARSLLRDQAIAHDIATPDLDAQLLLAHVAGVRRETLLAYPERPLTPTVRDAYADLIARRLHGEPVAYLVGHKEFMDLDLLTDMRALIPRPETELLVDRLVSLARARLAQGAATLSAADIGTGSGAIALALATGDPRIQPIYAVDISSGALDLAQENATHLGLAACVQFLHGDLCAPLPERVDLLLANLPYVARADAATLPEDVRLFEPALALYGADDGLELLRRFWAEAPAHVRADATIGAEFGYNQRHAVEALARAAFPAADVRIYADYAGWDRFVIAQL